MTWVTVLTSLFLLLSLTALVSWLVLYIQFCNSVEKRWAAQVLNLLHDADRCVRSENRQLQELKKKRDSEAQSLHERAFAAHLGDYSVDELEAYPGIGPATVGKLRAAGFVNLVALHRARIHIHGLGEKRLTDINHAIRDLLSKARRIFEAGSCRQAQVLTDQLAALSNRYDRLQAKARARIRAAEEFIDSLGEKVESARSVTFRHWFRPISNDALIPPELMEGSLPDLDVALRTAENPVAHSGIAKYPKTTADAVPVIEISAPSQVVTSTQTTKHASVIPANSEPEMPDETHLVMMELTIQFAFGVARADGPTTWTERELIQQHLRKRFGYNRALLNRAEAFLAQYETAAIDWEWCLGEINRRFTSEHRIALMEFAGQIVAVSGNETDRATPFLNRLSQYLRVPPVALPHREPASPSIVPPKPSPSPPQTFKSSAPQRPASSRVVSAAPPVALQLSSAVPAVSPSPTLLTSPPATPPVLPSPKPTGPTSNECLGLLEISPDTPLSADLVRRQWNLLSERLAPEKVASMGPEFVKLAQAKLAALRRAAESLLQAMGEKLETKPATSPAQDLRHNPDLDDVFGGM